MDFPISVASDLVATVLLWLILGLIVYIWLRLNQRDLLGFFGLNHNKELIVYLSNLWQPSEKSQAGSVISGHEFHSTESVVSLFGDSPRRLPELVRGLVDAMWAGAKPSVSIEVSPLREDDILFANMIVVGASPKNSVRRYYLKRGHLNFAVVGERDEPPQDVFETVLKSRVRYLTGSLEGEKVLGDFNVAIVEKILDKTRGTVVFFCVGSRGDSSWAAAEYLGRNWQKLRKRYRDRPFAICLGFPQMETYMSEYVRPKILARFPDTDLDF